jgi:hypothetical protein
MKPSSWRVRPRVDISYAPDARAASHRERSVRCNKGSDMPTRYGLSRAARVSK